NTLRVAPGASTSGYTPPVSVANGQVTAPSTLPTYHVSGSGGSAVVDQIFGSDGTTVNPSKVGYVYYLKGSAIGASNSDCGVGSSRFDGGELPDQGLVSLPGTLVGTNGNNVAAI